jgi:hypothetical protein
MGYTIDYQLKKRRIFIWWDRPPCPECFQAQYRAKTSYLKVGEQVMCPHCGATGTRVTRKVFTERYWKILVPHLTNICTDKTQ